MKVPRDISASNTPTTRLARLTDVMLNTLEKHPEYKKGDKAVILLTNDDFNEAGSVFAGYDDDLRDAVQDIITHLQVISKMDGISIVIVPMTESSN